MRIRLSNRSITKNSGTTPLFFHLRRSAYLYDGAFLLMSTECHNIPSICLRLSTPKLTCHFDEQTHTDERGSKQFLPQPIPITISLELHKYKCGRWVIGITEANVFYLTNTGRVTGVKKNWWFPPALGNDLLSRVYKWLILFGMVWLWRQHGTSPGNTGQQLIHHLTQTLNIPAPVVAHICRIANLSEERRFKVSTS